jgi:serine/threonine protein kinase
VRLATHTSGRKAACKILPALHQDPHKSVTWDQTVDAVEAHKEVVLLKALSGIKFSGVVELEGVIERDGWTYVSCHKNIHQLTPRYLFSTLHSHSVAEVQEPWDHDRLINFFRRLCISVFELHQLNISHEDIKRSNVLVDQISLPALIDFGFSHFSPYSEFVRSAGGTLDYSSPEKTEARECLYTSERRC